MGLKRFEQIHRFFSLNSSPTTPSNAPWFYRVQAVAELIRTACQNAYCPSSHLAIDEAMVAFKCRSRDIIKIKGKPIDTGYKLWCIVDHGYIWTWLFHSRVDGVETFTKSQQTRWPQMSVDSVGNPFLKSAAILGGSCTHYKCSKCLVWLCIEGPCWQQYHHSIGVNC
jgi:hypothetical protein